MEAKLIECVRSYIFIYDKSCKLYKNKIAIANAWEEIAKTLKLTPEECIAKWGLLRNTFTKALNKEKKIPSGSGALRTKPFKYMEEMGFLRPYIQKRRTFGNIETSPKRPIEEFSLNVNQTDEENEYDGGFSTNIQNINYSNIEILESALDSDEELFENVLANLEDSSKANEPQPGPSYRCEDKNKNKTNFEDKIGEAIQVIKDRNNETKEYPEVENFANFCASVLRRQKSKKKKIKNHFKTNNNSLRRRIRLVVITQIHLN